MKKHIWTTYLLLIFIIIGSMLASGCGAADTSDTSKPPVAEKPSTDDDDTMPDDKGKGQPGDDNGQKDIKAVILKKADEIVNLIKDRNYEELAKHVDSDKKLLFSPYSFINEDALRFDKDVIKDFAQRDDAMVWGTSDGSGEPIELTPNQYFERFVYNRDFMTEGEKLYDVNEQRGNMVKNIKDKFPDAITVEYYFKGTEANSGMDWSSLILVFEKGNGDDVHLVAIAHDQWTI